MWSSPGELAELVAGALTKDFPNLRRSELSLTLVDASSHPLSAFPRPLPAAAHRALERKGVAVRTGVMVHEVDTLQEFSGRVSDSGEGR